MFDNIGKKLKICGAAILILGIVGSVLRGFFYLTQSIEMLFIGIVIIVVGIISSCLVGWAMYGIGEVINTSDDIYRHVAKTSKDIEKISQNIERIANDTYQNNDIE